MPDEPLAKGRQVQTCADCDRVRAVKEHDRHRVGLPCDICGGSGIDYIGRRCRHGC